MIRIVYALMALAVLATTAAAAQESPSVELGDRLFHSTSLGTNDRSCATCHKNGKGLEDVADYEENKLAAPVNSCIVKALKGKPLAADSVELGSLLMYIKQLGKAGSR